MAGLLVLALALAAESQDEDAVVGPGADQSLRPETINGVAVPPSPADPAYHSGHRLYRLPTFTHWPAIVYADEQRNAAFHLPVPQRRPLRPKHAPDPVGASDDPRSDIGWWNGDSGTIGWQDGPRLPIVLPDDPEIERTSGLLDLPQALGRHRVAVTIGSGEQHFDLRIVDRAADWPHAGLINGFPVDDTGVPVVIRDQRFDPAKRRSWGVLREELPRQVDGPVWVVGDPLASIDGDVFAGLADVEAGSVQVRPASDQRYPQHAALVAFAGLDWSRLPRTIVYSPGNAAIHARVWSPEASRILDLLLGRCEQAGYLPRLVLLLPPLPVDVALQSAARARREHLAQRAATLGWQLLDAERLLAAFEVPNAVGEGLTTRYPFGKARQRLAAALREVVEAR